jgi:hypothetical protein
VRTKQHEERLPVSGHSLPLQASTFRNAMGASTCAF